MAASTSKVSSFSSFSVQKDSAPLRWGRKKFASWNVNGLRAILKKDFEKSIAGLAADVVCLQEVRAQPSEVDLARLAPTLSKLYPCSHWNPGKKKGYSGTLILSSTEGQSTLGMGIEEHDQEGRVITTNLGFATLVNVYTPNSGRGLSRLDYRKQWDNHFLSFLLNLRKSGPLIVCGDLNVAHTEIDLAHPETNALSAGFTIQERKSFSTLLEKVGLVDTFRFVHGWLPGRYSWWSNVRNCRARNIGWRVDYFLIDKSLIPYIYDAQIHSDIYGSDHCPVTLTLEL